MVGLSQARGRGRDQCSSLLRKLLRFHRALGFNPALVIHYFHSIIALTTQSIFKHIAVLVAMTQSLISRVELLEAKLRLAEHAIRDLEAIIRIAFEKPKKDNHDSDTDEMDSQNTKEEEVPKN